MTKIHDTCPNCGYRLTVNVFVERAMRKSNQAKARFEQSSQSIFNRIPGRSILAFFTERSAAYSDVVRGVEEEEEVLLRWGRGQYVILSITPKQLKKMAYQLNSRTDWTRKKLTPLSKAISQTQYDEVSGLLIDNGLLIGDKRPGQGAKKLTRQGLNVIRSHAGLRVNPTAF